MIRNDFQNQVSRAALTLGARLPAAAARRWRAARAAARRSDRRATKAVVHIGQPKAGSSTIQEFLKVNQTELARQGVRYDNARPNPPFGSQWEYAICALASIHRLLTNEDQRVRYHARSHEEQHAYAAHFVPHLTNFASTFDEPVAVFSSEHFYPWLDTPDKVAALDELFCRSFGKVDYVVYLRNQVDQLASAYSERIKRGMSVTVDRFIERRRKSLEFYTPVRRWADTVSDARLHVRLFERGSLVEGDLIDDFCALAGIDAAACERPDNANQALSAPAIECMRMLNRKFPEIKPDGGANPLRRDILQTVEEISADDEKFRFSQTEGETIEGHAQWANEQLRKRFYPERDTLFATRPALVAARDAARTRERALEIMAELVTRLRLGDIAELSEADKEASHRHDT